MKVKIGDKIYDSSIEPIMIILTESDKENISLMGSQTKYAVAPEDTDKETLYKFMQ